MLRNEAPKAGEVGGDGGNAHHRALRRRVAPRLVVAGKDAQVAAADKVVVADGEEGTGGVEKLRVEDDLDAVGALVEELRPANVLQHLVAGVVLHVVGDDRGKGVPLGGVDAPLQLHHVIWLDQVVGVGQAAAEGERGNLS